MKSKYIWLSMSLTVLSLPALVAQRTPEGLSEERTVPRLVPFNGTLSDGAGTAPHSVAGVTFALYKEQQSGVPLWQETQNVQLDANGYYTVLLGASKSDGLPAQLFTSNEARWLGVQPAGQAEQPRVLLLSVPYALKAADAETIGGLPPSAFVLATATVASDNAGSSGANVQPAITPALAGSGTLDFIPLWTPNGSTLGNSILFQNTSSNIGIGTQTPGAKLDVAGSAKVRGTLLLPAAGAATASAGKNSQPLNLAASAFNSGTATAVNQTFSWRAEPVGNNTASASGTLNLLFGVGSSTPTETGLQIGSGGLFTFAPGQTFPGAGTITGVSAGTGLTGGGTSGNVTLSLDTTKVPQLSTANTFTANQSINASLSVTGTVSGAAGSFSGNLSTTGNLTGQTGVLNGTSAVPLMQISQSGTGTGMSVVASGNDGMDVSSTAPSKSAVAAQVTGTAAIAINGFANNTSEVAVQGTGGGTAGRGQATAPGATAVAGISVGGLSGEFSGGPVLIFPSATFSSAFMLQLQSNNQLGEIIQAPVSGVGSALDLQTTGSGGSQWELLATGNTAAQGVGKLNIRNVTTGADDLTIASNGFIGIATASPDNELTVNGNADKPGGGSWGTFSDGRLKTVDSTYDSGLDAILKLTPVRYRYKEQNAMGIRDHEEHVGLVAQEVEKAIPEAVSTNSQGYLLVNNDPIIWAMLNAIKQQQHEIEALTRVTQDKDAQIQKLAEQVHEITKENRLLAQSDSESGNRLTSAVVITARQGH